MVRVKPPGVLILPEDQNIAPGEAGYPQAAERLLRRQVAAAGIRAVVTGALLFPLLLIPPYPFPFSAGWA